MMPYTFWWHDSTHMPRNPLLTCCTQPRSVSSQGTTPNCHYSPTCLTLSSTNIFQPIFRGSVPTSQETYDVSIRNAYSLMMLGNGRANSRACMCVWGGGVVPCSHHSGGVTSTCHTLPTVHEYTLKTKSSRYLWKNKIWPWVSNGHETKCDCAGEVRQQYNRIL
jgi:hypothetical protein